MELMQMIKGITFAPFSRRGKLDTKAARASLRNLKKLTGANLIILVPNGLQETPQSETIARETQANATDEEFLSIIEYAHSLGLSVALKPTVNCMNGTWRAHISFFDKDVPCEPKWSNWFASYTAFQLHYAALAEKSGCEMFIAGCEMVMSEHRDAEWRKLISDIKEVYHGPVSYNTDKYQEDNVTWWDCVDVISSSGYYPVNDWENQLDRIEKVVKNLTSPFSSQSAAACLPKAPFSFPTTGASVGRLLLTNRLRGTRPCLRPAKSAPLSEASVYGTGLQSNILYQELQPIPAMKFTESLLWKSYITIIRK